MPFLGSFISLCLASLNTHQCLFHLEVGVWSKVLWVTELSMTEVFCHILGQCEVILALKQETRGTLSLCAREFQEAAEAEEHGDLHVHQNEL